MDSHLTAIIDRAEGDFIVLRVSGDQELYWPKQAINFHYAIGDAVNIYLTKDEAVAADGGDQAKAMLRRIFQPNV